MDKIIIRDSLRELASSRARAITRHFIYNRRDKGVIARVESPYLVRKINRRGSFAYGGHGGPHERGK